MEVRSQSRLASVLSLLVGLWVLLSPIWVTVSGAAFVSVIIVGIIMIIAAATQLFLDNTVPSWINGVLAVWLLLSAFIFGVGSAATTSQVISAVLAFIFAYWYGMEVNELHTVHRTTN